MKRTMCGIWPRLARLRTPRLAVRTDSVHRHGTKLAPMHRLAATLLLALLLTLIATDGPRRVHAAGTAPPLSIRHAEATKGATHTWLRLEGTFPSGDLVQQPYPLQIIVREIGSDDDFVWFAPPGATRTGRTGFTSLGPSWIEALEASAAEDPSSRILHFGPESIEVQLGPGFAASEGEAVFLVVYQGGPVFSNRFRFEVEETTP